MHLNCKFNNIISRDYLIIVSFIFIKWLKNSDYYNNIKTNLIYRDWREVYNMMQIIIFTIILSSIIIAIIQNNTWSLVGGLRSIYLKNNQVFLHTLLMFIAFEAIFMQLLSVKSVMNYEPSTYGPIAIIIGSFVFGVAIMLLVSNKEKKEILSHVFGNGLFISSFLVMSIVLSAQFFTDIINELKQIQVKDNSIAETFGVNNSILSIALIIFIILASFQFNKNKTGSVKQQLKSMFRLLTLTLLIGSVIISYAAISERQYDVEKISLMTPLHSFVTGVKTGNFTSMSWSVYAIGLILAALYIFNRGKINWTNELIVKSVGSGILLAISMSLAGDCLIGNALIQTAVFAWQGWLSLGFMTVGIWTASYFISVKPAFRKTAIKLN